LTLCQIWKTQKRTSCSAPDQQRSSAPDPALWTRSAQQLKTAHTIQKTAQQRAQISAAKQLKTCIFLMVLKRRFFAFF
jgi:DNA polymerase IIIc chi subunit